MPDNILVIDDEEEFLKMVNRALVTAGYKKTTMVSKPQTLVDVLNRGQPFDLALIDITMPVVNGLEALTLIKNITPQTECIMVSARNEAEIAVECLKKGAYDYLVKPIRANDLLRVVDHALEKKRLLDIVELSKSPLSKKPIGSVAFRSILTNSSTMFCVMREAELHSKSDMSVLISGESGTGKELLARAVHDSSPRCNGEFTPINMGSLSENLFESAFFGHVKGAFTGAQNDHKGFLEASEGGTIFLDEIGTLPLELQGKLLRVLQEREFIKLGTNKPRSANIRFIAATNADLVSFMAKGQFRKDMFYRLRGAHLYLPPLRERKEDIPLLIAHFITEYSGGSDYRPEVTDGAMSMFMSFDYPGNIRELKAIVQAALNLSQGGPISETCLPADLTRMKSHTAVRLQKTSKNFGPITTLAEIEKEHIQRVHKETGANLTQSATILGISLNTLRRKLDAYGIARN